MAPIKCDVRGSPRVFKAAHLIFTNPAIDTDDAMKLAGYSRREISCRRIRKSISKKKGRLMMQSNAKNNTTKKKKLLLLLLHLLRLLPYQILPFIGIALAVLIVQPLHQKKME
jgi:predicted histidine transporter YuiF (NhaC family)